MTKKDPRLFRAIQLTKLLAANERAIREKRALEARMATIDHTSPEKAFIEKCNWLAAQGRGNDLARLLTDRQKYLQDN